MTFTLSSWQFWAVLSAAFAALTAIFAKVGVENVNSDFATFIRTIVILLVLAAILARHRRMAADRSISGRTYAVPRALGARHRRVVALLLPGAQARRCGARRADRQAQRRAGRGIRRRLPGREAARANWPGVALIAGGAILVAAR